MAMELVRRLPYNHPYRWDGTEFGGPKLWRPTEIQTSLWLDAEDTSTITLNGSTVSQWSDKSGNSYFFEQTSAAAQPSYTIIPQNGKAGIEFSTTKFLQRPVANLTNFATGSSASLFVAARNASTNAGWNIITKIWWGAPGAQRYHLSFNYNAGAGYVNGTTLYANAAFVGNNTTPIATSQNCVIGFTISPSSSTIHTNGVSQSFSGQSLPNAVGSEVCYINDERSDSALGNNIVVFEMVATNSQLSAQQAQKIEGYLAWKWGIEASLPSGHPYKLFPPTV